MSMIEWGPVQQGELLGGGGGQPFSDRIPDGARICEVTVRHGDCIDGIRISYMTPDGTKVDCPYHGGQGGTETTFTIDAGQWLSPDCVSSGDYVDALTLSTQEYAPTSSEDAFTPYAFGGSGGQPDWGCGLQQLELDGFGLDMQVNDLVGIHGRSGDLLDAIGFWYRTAVVHP